MNEYLFELKESVELEFALLLEEVKYQSANRGSTQRDQSGLQNQDHYVHQGIEKLD